MALPGARRRYVSVVQCVFIWRAHSFCGRVDTAHGEDVVTPGRGRQRKKVESKRRVAKGGRKDKTYYTTFCHCAKLSC
jgi:hypothetical protein